MTDTETPIEAGARALHDRTYAGLDVGLWERRTEVGRERFVGDAGAVFGSVDIEGLAEVLIQHRDYREWDDGLATGGFACRCGTEVETGLRPDPEFRRHQAEAVVAWLMGGGA